MWTTAARCSCGVILAASSGAATGVASGLRCWAWIVDGSAATDAESKAHAIQNFTVATSDLILLNEFPAAPRSGEIQGPLVSNSNSSGDRPRSARKALTRMLAHNRAWRPVASKPMVGPMPLNVVKPAIGRRSGRRRVAAVGRSSAIAPRRSAGSCRQTLSAKRARTRSIRAANSASTPVPCARAFNHGPALHAGLNNL